ncbi:MAG TPA: hypothetical protein VK524_01690, partial [Polyangiaceae bacterium]|nr:hypothetical protein [Polyangiaceae bacterium]
MRMRATSWVVVVLLPLLFQACSDDDAPADPLHDGGDPDGAGAAGRDGGGSGGSSGGSASGRGGAGGRPAGSGGSAGTGG